MGRLPGNQAGPLGCLIHRGELESISKSGPGRRAGKIFCHCSAFRSTWLDFIGSPKNMLA
jgi:hypothetical protein